MPLGLGAGTPIARSGAHGRADGKGSALVVECGQHFKRSSAELATQLALDVLGHVGPIDREVPPARPPGASSCCARTSFATPTSASHDR